MFLNVRVIPGSSRTCITQEQDCLKVRVTAPAREGLANAQLIKVLSEHLKIKKYRIKIIKGDTSRNKVVEISDG